MKVIIIKTQIFDNMKFDLIITLTYILMDNFCSCFIKITEMIQGGPKKRCDLEDKCFLDSKMFF